MERDHSREKNLHSTHTHTETTNALQVYHEQFTVTLMKKIHETKQNQQKKAGLSSLFSLFVLTETHQEPSLNTMLGL